MPIVEFHAMPEPTTNKEKRVTQALGVDPKDKGRALKIDGIVGPKTKRGEFYAPPKDPHPLVAAALKYLYAEAKQATRENRGPWIRHFFFTDKPLRGPAQWCAAFVSRCLNDAYGDEAPKSWGARRMGDKFEKLGARIGQADLRPGDIVTWKRRSKNFSYAGHIGIVCEVTDEHVYVIEGNVGPYGQVRVFRYDRPSLLRWGRDAVWKLVRPDMVLTAKKTPEPECTGDPETCALCECSCPGPEPEDK